jgi:MFS family permease
MRLIWKSFRSLYSATLLMLLGSGLLSTYLALRLAETLDGLWVGALMAANYIGLVLGGKLGHRLIGRVGHIRAYVACAGVVTAAVLGHGLTDWLPAWLLLRMLVGLAMMCQYMVIESWLNEQAETSQRGQVFSGYMAASYLGLILGQLVLVVHPTLGLELLMLVALCFALCLVPVALTHRLHPAPMHPASLELRFFIKRVPLSLTTIAVAGLMIGAFYGLAPLYATRMGLSTEQVGLFMGSCIFAGLVVQWPLGWLSDRYDRAGLIRGCAVLLALAALPLALMPEADMWVLFSVGFVIGLLQFSLYPLAVAFANDHVEGELRVSLTAMLLVTFGIGASIGPLLAGVLMRFLGANMLYAFICCSALILIWRVRPDKVSHLHQVDDAPLHHIAMPDNMTSSPLVAALDPRVDEQVVQDQMLDGNVADMPDAGAVDGVDLDQQAPRP